MSVEIYYQPIKKYLVEYITAVGHSAKELSPIIEAAVQQTLEANQSLSLSSPRIARQKLETDAKIYVDGVMGQNKKWLACKDKIKAFMSVFLVGAGLSTESNLPLTYVLNDLLTFLHKSNWEELRNSPQDCLEFKKQFKAMCDEKSPCDAHVITIKNFPSYIKEIICLNWDDFFERSATALQIDLDKVNIDKPVSTQKHLWKFHGDVDVIGQDNVKGQGGWVFPDEQGFVFNSFIDYLRITNLKSQMFSFIIVGYSERETEIIDKIISLFENNPPRPTYRIGPQLKFLPQNNYLVGPSYYTLAKIFPVALK